MAQVLFTMLCFDHSGKTAAVHTYKHCTHTSEQKREKIVNKQPKEQTSMATNK